ncbi:MAG: DJ-1/PfpI family protein [Tannerellaceae bacterium]|jgi:4-methyl-5(b-hydroxyethyl)-thiazole monophosphate biosynthesis|nr:DJ-1/PfpI family protein [Tannerellaceae bacterium]
MKRAVLFLATGFEETEAVGTVDVLRRGEIDVTVVSVTGERAVTGAHDVTLVADALFDEVSYESVDALVLPGGMPGSANLNACEPLKKLLTEHYAKGKTVAAICAAPLVFGGLGFVDGRKATCYPSFEPYLAGARITDEAVAVDGNVITGKGPGLVFDFALAIVSRLQGGEVKASVSAQLLL